jgi:hypothetical protein
MPKNIVIFIFIFAIIPRLGNTETSWSIDADADWLRGQGVNIDSQSRKGQISIQSNIGVNPDEFDVAGKMFWQSLGSAFSITSSLDKIRIFASFGQPNTNIGIFSTAFTPPTEISIETKVDAGCSGCTIGGIFFYGLSPTVSTVVTGASQIIVNQGLGISIGTPVVFLKIQKTGSLANSYYRKNLQENWTQIASVQVVAPTNLMGVGLGIITGSIITTIAEYEYFRVTPFSPKATWDSGGQDLTKTPTTQGVISWLQDTPVGTGISLQTATSDNGVDWSTWSAPYIDSLGSVITSTSRRFIRVAATLVSDDSHTVAPVLKRIEIKYANAAPLTPILNSSSHPQNQWSNQEKLTLQWHMPTGNPAPESAYTYWVAANGVTVESQTVALPPASVGMVHSRSITLTAEGQYHIALQAQADQFSGGLTTTVVAYNFSFDKTPPSGVVITSPTHPELLFANNNSPVFDFAATDAMSGVSGYAVSLDKLAVGDPGAAINVWGNEKRYLNLENGTYYVHARAVDAAGNTGPVNQYGIRIDFSGDLLGDPYVKALPNPVRLNEAKIEYQLAAAASEVTLEFMNGQGEIVLRVDGNKAIGKNYYAWDVSRLANGIYFCRIKAKSTEDGKSYSVTKKIAIIR